MEFTWWASWVLALFGVATVFFAGRNKWWAWGIGIVTEILWIWYSVVTEQHGFIFASLAYIAVYIKNTKRWRASLKIEEVGDGTDIHLQVHRETTEHPPGRSGPRSGGQRRHSIFRHRRLRRDGGGGR